MGAAFSTNIKEITQQPLQTQANAQIIQQELQQQVQTYQIQSQNTGSQLGKQVSNQLNQVQSQVGQLGKQLVGYVPEPEFASYQTQVSNQLNQVQSQVGQLGNQLTGYVSAPTFASYQSQVSQAQTATTNQLNQVQSQVGQLQNQVNPILQPGGNVNIPGKLQLGSALNDNKAVATFQGNNDIVNFSLQNTDSAGQAQFVAFNDVQNWITLGVFGSKQTPTSNTAYLNGSGIPLTVTTPTTFTSKVGTSNNTLDDGSGNMQVKGTLSVAGQNVNQLVNAGTLTSTPSVDTLTANNVMVNQQARLNNNAMYFRSNNDPNHYVVYSSDVDGPNLAGFTGGKVTVTGAGGKAPMWWNQSGVNFSVPMYGNGRNVNLNGVGASSGGIGGVCLQNPSGSQFCFQDDGNAVIYNQSGAHVWASNTTN